MIEYVTVPDVDTLLGPDWAGSGDKDLAVYQANAYLNTLRFKAWETQPETVTRAGAELAKEAAAGRLYADQTPAIKRKKVKADTVESETEYQDGAVPTSGAMSFISALLAPWIIKAAAVQFLRKV